MSDPLALGLTDNYVVLEVEDPSVEAWLRLQLRFCLRREGVCSGRYSVRGTDGQSLIAEGPEGEIATADSVRGIAEPLVQDLLERLARTCSTCLAFHAAGVFAAGGGVMLAGASGRGKSTLASACLLRGFDYLSDEVICVCVDAGRMTGFPRPINLKSGSSFVVQDWLGGQGRVENLPQGIHWVDPASFRSGKPADAAPLTAIVLPEFTPRHETVLRRLNSAEAVLAFLRLHVNSDQLLDKGFPMVADLARRVPCWKLVFCDALHAAESIEHTITIGGRKQGR